jgi:uncharacterized membrane protein
MAQTHVQEHIDLIAKHEEKFLARRTTSEKWGDAVAGFAGSLTFVCLHLVLFGLWVLVNSVPELASHRFDPPPFSLLSTVVALEAILLASFILMRQSRMGRRAEERDHLMLQVLLLSEKEMTALLRINRRMAEETGLNQAANSPTIQELSKDISVEDIAQTITDSLPRGEG